MGSAKCEPATLESQMTLQDGEVGENAYLFNLLKEGYPLQTSINVDAVMRQFVEQKRAYEEQRRANEELLQQNATLARRLALRRDSSLIDLDEVDDEDMEDPCKFSSLRPRTEGRSWSRRSSRIPCCTYPAPLREQPCPSCWGVSRSQD